MSSEIQERFLAVYTLKLSNAINIFYLYNLWSMVKMQAILVKYLVMHTHHLTVSTSSV